ncbi:unnamed protein product, partial [marine sediment metagenome]
KVADVRRTLGVKQPTQFERVLRAEEATAKTVFETDAGVVFGTYAEELSQVAGWEGIARPLLRALGKTPKELISPDLLVAVTRANITQNVVQKTQGVVQVIRGGTTTRRTAAHIRRLSASEALPEEVKVTLDRLGIALDDYLAAVPEVSRQAGAAARATGRAAKGTAESMVKGPRGGRAEAPGAALRKSADAAARAEDAKAATAVAKEAQKRLASEADIVAKELETHGLSARDALAG